MFSHTILPVPYFLADNAGPGLCLQWKEIFCAGHNSIFMAVLSTQEEYLQPVIIPGTCLANTKFPSLLPAQHWTDKGVLIMEKINWNKAWFMAVCWTKSILWYNILKCRYEKFQKQMVFTSIEIQINGWNNCPGRSQNSYVFRAHKELSKNISICGLESKWLVYFVLKNDLKYLQFWG